MIVKAVLLILGIIVIALLFGTKIINWETVEETNGASYNDATVIGFIILGGCALASSIITFLYFKTFILISFGLGVASIVYAFHIASCKGMLGLIPVHQLISYII